VILLARRWMPPTSERKRPSRFCAIEQRSRSFRGKNRIGGRTKWIGKCQRTIEELREFAAFYPCRLARAIAPAEGRAPPPPLSGARAVCFNKCERCC
jgi:hypothetical protein